MRELVFTAGAKGIGQFARELRSVHFDDARINNMYALGLNAHKRSLSVSTKFTRKGSRRRVAHDATQGKRALAAARTRVQHAL